jgi:hypothetical protein
VQENSCTDVNDADPRQIISRKRKRLRKNQLGKIRSRKRRADGPIPKFAKEIFEKAGGESGHFHHQPQIETSTFELARNPRSIPSPVSVPGFELEGFEWIPFPPPR